MFGLRAYWMRKYFLERKMLNVCRELQEALERENGFLREWNECEGEVRRKERDEARRWALKLWRENEALKAERDEALQYARNVWSTGDYVYIPEEARRAKRQGVE